MLMTNKLPKQKAYFLSHGSPTLIFDNVEARDFIMGLAKDIQRPKAIVMVSAHWETQSPNVNSVEINSTIHDFYGFPEKMYQLRYEPKGDKALAQDIVNLLAENGLMAGIDENRGLDHGAWVPLKLMYPEADIPVLQLSIQSHLGTGHHYELGRAISKLRDENILIIASGSFTHNLREINWRGGPEAEWSKQFSDWFHAALIKNRVCDLLAYRRLAPFAQKNHPTDEHLLPIFVALGAASPDPQIKRIHSSVTFGSLRMDAYSFE
jgi:4,5-DOPA dioxygenase extradiol